MPHQHIFRGSLCALGAGIVWGLVFVTPLILPDYPPAMLAFGRYLAFGAICLPLAWRDRRQLARLELRDWLAALELSLVGNILYYLSLATAIQNCGGTLPTLIIGTLPVVIALVSNLHRNALPWLQLAPSLAAIATGIVLVNRFESAAPGATNPSWALGILSACMALACWTWYPVRNARWLQQRPSLSSSTWATAQGLTTLPLSLGGMLITCEWLGRHSGFPIPLGPRPLVYVGMMLCIGLMASWLGTLLWNRASRLLPTALVGQLIVFETLAALTYTYIWLSTLPTLAVSCGIALLLTGVMLGIRAFHKHGTRQS